MARYKEYTEQSSPNNDLIKLAKKKGLTNIKIEWFGAMAYQRHLCGWNISCDQILHKNFYDKSALIKFLKTTIA